jgi:hypothetical protein
MISEGSLQFLQQPATGPYPEPDESSQHSDTLFKIHININFVMYTQLYTILLFTSGFPENISTDL